MDTRTPGYGPVTVTSVSPDYAERHDLPPRLTPDHDFVVDRDDPVTVLAGFSGHGFKFAPVIGELAAHLVAGRPWLRRFALNRHTSPATTG